MFGIVGVGIDTGCGGTGLVIIGGSIAGDAVLKAGDAVFKAGDVVLKADDAVLKADDVVLEVRDAFLALIFVNAAAQSNAIGLPNRI